MNFANSRKIVKSFRLITRAGSSVLIIMTSILPKRGTVADSQKQSVVVVFLVALELNCEDYELSLIC